MIVSFAMMAGCSKSDAEETRCELCQEVIEADHIHMAGGKAYCEACKPPSKTEAVADAEAAAAGAVAGAAEAVEGAVDEVTEAVEEIAEEMHLCEGGCGMPAQPLSKLTKGKDGKYYCAGCVAKMSSPQGDDG